MLSLILAANLLWTSTQTNDDSLLILRGRAAISSFAEVRYEAIPYGGVMFINLVDKGSNKSMRSIHGFSMVTPKGTLTLKDLEQMAETEGRKLYIRQLQYLITDARKDQKR